MYLSVSETNGTFSAAHPTVLATVPSHIGGSNERLVVIGSRFRDLSLLKCVFGSSPAQLSDASFINSSAVSCAVPRLQNPNVWVSLAVSLTGTKSTHNTMPFLVRYAAPPLVVSASPLIGSHSGGTLTKIVGQGMLSFHELWCNYVGIGSTRVILVSSTFGQCKVPASLRFGGFRTTLQVVSARERSKVLASFKFSVAEHLKTTHLSPRLGLMTGGYNITISTTSTELLKAEGFSDIFCVIGVFRVAAYVVDSSTVMCTAPSAEQPMSVPVSLSAFGSVDSEGTKTYFTYLPAIRLANATPPRSPVAGNATVLVQTLDVVHPGVACLFGSIRVPGKVVSDRELLCTTPSHPEDAVSLRLGVDGSSVLSENAITFEFYRPTESFSLSPSNKILFNKSHVAISGSKLASAASIKCIFRTADETAINASVVLPASFVSDTRVECPVPRFGHSPISLHLSLEVDNVAVVRDQGFLFVEELRVLSISPVSGFVHGGTAVHVAVDPPSTGNMTYTCMFGATTVPATRRANKSVVVCPSPPSFSAEAVPIQVSANGMDFFSSSNRVERLFRYLPRPFVSSYSPSIGSSKGGTLITLSGSNFDTEVDFVCVFNAMTKVPATVINSTAAVCRVPADRESRGDATVTLSDRDATFEWKLQRPFAYVEDIQVTSIYPTAIPANYNHGVQVVGTNFPQVDSLSCLFGGSNLSASATRISSTLVVCEPPIPHQPLVQGNSSVAVSWNGQEWGTAHQIQILQPFQLRSAYPQVFSCAGGMGDIHLSGRGFARDSPLICFFNGVPVPASYINATSAVCRAPFFSHATEVLLRLSSFDGFFADGRVIMKCFPTPILTSVQPESASTTGHTMIDVFHSSHSSDDEFRVLCCFNRVVCTIGSRRNATRSACATPPSTSGESILHLAVGNGSVGWVNSTETLFRFISPPEVYNVLPRQMIYAPGGRVSIFGRSFADSVDLSCQLRFHHHVQYVAAQWKSKNLVFCSLVNAAMKLTSREVVEVFIGSNTDDDFVATGFNITLLPEPELRAVSLPSQTETTSEKGLTLTGYDFDAQIDFFCRFDDGFKAFSVAANAVNTTLLNCPLPSWTGQKNVRVSVWTQSSGIVKQGGSVFTVNLTSQFASWSIAPNHGAMTGNTPLKVVLGDIRGGQRSGNWSCCFNRTFCTPLQGKEPAVLVCAAPPSDIQGVVPIELFDERGVLVHPQKNWFYYSPSPKVLSIYPTQSTSKGGELIYVYGHGFSASRMYKCRFGSELVDAVQEFDNRIYCVAPSQPAQTALSHVSFAVLAGTSPFEQLVDVESAAPMTFGYVLIPAIWNATIRSASPMSQEAMSSIDFDIFGEDFSGEPTMVCRIGEGTVSAIAVGSNRVRCTSSMSITSGKVLDVAVSNDGALFSDSTLVDVGAANVLQLSSLSPSFGSIRGSNVIVLTGSHLDKFGSLQCVYGWEASANRFHATAAILSGSFAQCVVNGIEEDGAWQIPVALYSSSYNVYSNRLLYRYADDYTVSSLTPSRAVHGSATSVFVRGSRFIFARHVRCLFREEEGAFKNTVIVDGKWKSPYEVECKLSSSETKLKSARYQAEIALNGVDFYPTNRTFEVIVPPEVTNIWPLRGPTRGNTGVAFYGSRFTQEMTCCFDEMCVPANTENQSTALCRTPQHASGNVSIALHLGVGAKIPMDLQFEFVGSPQVAFVEPGVFVFGSQLSRILRVGGANFDPEVNPTCQFGDFFETAGETINSTLVKCPLPSFPFVNHSVVEFSLSYEGDDDGMVSAKDRVLYIEVMRASSIRQIRPNKVAIGNGFRQQPQPFELRGRFYFVSQQVVCHFNCSNGEHIYDGRASLLSQEIAECEMLAPFEEPGECAVSLVQGNTRISTIHDVTVTIGDRIQVTRVLPSFGPVTGGTLLKLEGTGFSVASQPLCHFGRETFTKGFVASATTVYCSTPEAMAWNQTQEIEMWVSDSGIASIPHIFTFHAPARVTEIHPTFGPVTGGTRIALSGENFSSRFTFHCLFDGDHQVVAEWHATNKVSCTTPQLEQGRHMLTLLVNGVDQIESDFVKFTTVPLEVLFGIDPAKGISSSKSEGAVTVIRGANFIDSEYLTCRFGEVESVATFLSSTSVECSIPFMPSGVKAVRIANNGLDFTPSIAPIVVAYEVLPRLFVDHIAPRNGPLTGGTLVQMVGVFSAVDDIECAFGEKRVLAVISNSSHLSCVAPAAHTSGGVLVTARVGTSFAHFDNESSVTFEYVPSPKVVGVSPSILSQSSKLVLITISGNGFDSVDVVGCRFSGYSGKLVSKSAIELKCQFNPALIGSFEVEILTAASVWSAIATYQRIRVIRAVEPRAAYPSRFDERGGVQLVVTAHNLFPAALSVKCGFGEHIVDALVLSESKVRCITPPLAPGKVVLRLSQDSVSWSSTGLDVVSFASPILFRVSPQHGVASGGSEITVYGTNFKHFPASSCRFDDIEALAVSVNASAIKCITPSFPAGREVSLRVSLNAFEVSLNALRFAFDDLPQQLRLQSVSEFRAGQYSAIINGTNFGSHEEYECRFDGRPHTELSINYNEQTMSCISPTFRSTRQRPSGFVLMMNGQRLLEERIETHAECPAVINGISSQTIQSSRIQSVTISGFRFGADMDIQCQIGSTAVQARRTSENAVACNVPGKPPGKYSLQVVCVTAAPQVLATFALEYLPPLIVHTFYPQVFPTRGHYAIELLGTYFTPFDHVFCSFGGYDTLVPASYVSSTNMRCSTPVVLSAGDIQFAVFATSRERDQRTLLVDGVLTFVALPRTLTLTPSFGSTGGLFSTSLSGDGVDMFVPYRCRFVGELGEEAASIDRSGGVDIAGNVLPCNVPRLRSGEYEIYITPNGRDYVSTLTTFTAHAPVQLVRVDPPFAVAYGGTDLVVSGRGFQPWMKFDCGFQAAHSSQWTISPASYVSPTELGCTTPEHEPGKVSFHVLPVSSQLPASRGISFAFTPEIVLHSIHPHIASTEDFTVIDVVGQGFYFSPDLQCRFSDMRSSGTFVNASLVRCRAPPHAASTTVPVQVSFDGLNVLPYTFSVTYLPVLEIDRVYDTQELPGLNRSRLHVVGSRLAEHTNLSCEFDRPSPSRWPRSFTAKWKSVAMHHDREVSCLVPDSVPTGPVAVRLVDALAAMPSNIVLTEHISRFTVKRIYPSRGSADGGYTLVVLGDLFPDIRPVVCNFGGTQVIGERVSSYQIQCVVPRAGEQRSPRIYLRFGDSQVFSDTSHSFTYLPRASVHHIRPTLGWTRGGTKVTVYGARMPFSSSIECVFGEIAVPATYVSSRELVCTSPAMMVARRAVFVVRTSGGDWDSPVAIAFEAIAVPVIQSVTPYMGPSDGGTNVLLRGNFTTMLSRSEMLFCSFEGNGAATARIASGDTITCTSPPVQRQNAVTLGLFYQASDIASTGFSFRYASNAEFFKVVPAMVPERWEGYLSVHGINFFPSAKGFCALGNFGGQSALRFISSQEIQCFIPKLVPGKHSVQVSLHGDEASPTGKSLVVTKLPQVLQMSPAVDSLAGGSLVQFEGLHLRYVPSLVCVFGVKRVRARFQDDTIVCVAPNASYATIDHERVNVSLLSRGSLYSHQTFAFDYVRSPRILTFETVVAEAGLFEEALVLCGKHLDEFPVFVKLLPSLEEDRTSVSSQGKRWNSSCQSFVVRNVRGDECRRGCDIFASVNNQSFTFTGMTVVLGIEPQVTHVEPRYGSANGGDVIRVMGRNLLASLRLFCVFGTEGFAKEAVARSTERVECVTPRHHAGVVNMSIVQATPGHVNELNVVVAVVEFGFIAPIELLAIHPMLGLARGGTQVTVSGKGFAAHRDLSCRFGEHAVPAVVVNSTVMLCMSPPRFARKEFAAFAVTLGSTVATALADLTFTYVETPFVQAIAPMRGIYNSHYTISVYGTGFTSGMTLRCRFGDAMLDVPGTFVSSELVQCPLTVDLREIPQPALLLSLALSVDGLDYFDSGFAFKVTQPAVLVEISPRTVVASVTEEVTLRYINLDSFADLECVYLELNATTPARFVNDDHLACALPRPRVHLLRPGSLSVGVLRNGTQHSANTLTIEVIQTPEISGFTPRSGAITSSSSQGRKCTSDSLYVVVQGKNFPPFRRIQCRFGSLLSSGTFQTMNRIRCLVPDSSISMLAPVSVSFNNVDFVDAPGSFEYIDNFFIRQVVPSNGAITGGTRIHIRGGSFDGSDNITCQFGETTSPENALVQSSTELVCVLPRMQALGSVAVTIHSENRRTAGSLRNAFTVTKQPAITSVWPLAAFEKSETLFDVYGVGFRRSPTLRCTFGANRSTMDAPDDTAIFTHAIWLSSIHVKCISPSTIKANRATQVGVTNNGVDFVYAGASQGVAFSTQFEAESIYPSFGTVNGGTKVTIQGEHFDLAQQRIWCRFGTIPKLSIGSVLSSNEIVCVSPRYEQSTYGMEEEGSTASVALSVNGKDFLPTHQAFTYVKQPRVTRISPIRGAMDGSTVVSVIGANLVSGLAWCRFGATEVRAMVLSTSELSCITPPHEYAESVTIEVSTNDGIDYTDNGLLYSYHQTPHFRRVTPITGPSSGDTLVTVHGLNFYHSKFTKCCFADRYHCTRGWLADRRKTQIKCRSPPAAATFAVGAAGSLLVPILVTLNGQDFFTLEKQFEYVLDTVVEEITPRVADTAGGTVVHVTGRHFRYSSTLACRFDNLITSATFLNASAISCVAPAHSPGGAKVGVTLNGQDFSILSSSNSSFTFINVPTAYFISSDAGSIRDGLTLHVRGSGFANSTTLACHFQDGEYGSVRIVPAQFVSPTSVTCKAPRVEKSGTVGVFVAVDGISSSRQEMLTVSYLEAPMIYRVDPPLGSVDGGTKLTVVGNAFTPAASLECCFEQKETALRRTCVKAHFLSDKQLRCVTPTFAAPRSASLSIHANNVVVAQTSIDFQVHGPIQLTHVSPKRGAFSGGTTIHVHGRNFMFTPQVSCCIGDVLVPATFVNTSLLECTTPRYSAGSALIKVSNNGQECYGGDAVQSFDFTFEMPAVVKQITPASGTQLGGSVVIVDGANFVHNSSVCFFGSRRSPLSQVMTESRMECHVPPQLDLVRERLAVTNNGLDYSTGLIFFTYLSAEDVLTVFPSRVASINGGILSLATKNAINTGNLSCFFDEISVRAIFASSTQVHCAVPHLEPGLKRVYISNDGVIKSRSSAMLEVVNPPTIASVKPTKGFVSGGQVVTVEGSRLQFVSHCRFGNLHVVAKVSSSFRIECIAPPQQVEGDVSLQLLDTGAELLSEQLEFTYVSAINRAATRKGLLEQQESPPDADAPSISSIYPQTASATGGTHILVSGINFQNSNELVCHFGKTVVRARYQSAERVVCVSPRLAPQKYRFQVSNDGYSLSNDRTSITVYTDAFVQSIAPAHGPHIGGTTVTVFGMHFARTSELRCRFGDEKVQIVKFVSANEVVCIAPMQRGSASVVHVSVTNDNDSFTPNPVFFTYTIVGSVVSVTPRFGSLSGGTALLVRAYNLEIHETGGVLCRIGGASVAGELLSSTLVRCVTPGSETPGKYAVELSVNGQDFTHSHVLFEYTADIHIERITPNLGPSVDANTVITVHGSGFLNTIELACFFDAVRSPATWHSPARISCAAPRQVPHGVTVRVSINGLDKSHSSARYLYHKDVALSRITPSNGLLEGGTPVFFQGRSFVNHTLMSCRFGEHIVAANYLSASMLTCIAPRQLDNLRATDGRVAVEVSSNRVDFSKSGLIFTYVQHCPISQHCSNSNIRPCPNGTICESHGSGNFSLCPPGTFQPRQAQVACLKCPVGFFCPDHGLSKPVLCRPGMVCDTHGLQVPVKTCPSGHYCRKGTKTANISDFTTNSEYTTDKETQLVSFLDTNRAWTLIPRIAPAVGSRRIEHPPNETSCDYRLCVENSVRLLAERPYACPVGMYCKRGVAQQQLRAKNFSTPQKCFQGFFCPRGSSTPEGQGPCPSGHYCPTDVDAVVCPAGQYCPGVGNVRPRDCYPGTYNPIPKQSNCTLCPSGYVCPQWKMLAPVLCPAGFVCISTGLSSPALLCPPGYVCALGTRTLDPSDIIPFRPLPCPKGTYCLGGVAHNVTVDWLPNREEGAVAPQTCTEGTFCGGATRSVSGTAVCFSGHYCPPGSSSPTQAPVGSFSGSTGSVASTLCFPGTYTPLKGTVACEVCPAGHSCSGFGTYIPSLCPKGQYRSLADSITCRSCPEGTWSHRTGVTDISLCEICPSGRVCGSSAMSTLSSSLPCAAGYVCGEGTNRRSQFDHLCPGGHYCYSATTIEEQYAHTCEKGYACQRGTKYQEKNKNKCLDGKFCPLGTANMSSIYIQCPKDTWTGSGQDELLDCAIRPVSICDKSPTKQYYPKFTYLFQGSEIRFDSTVEASRTGEIEVVQVVYPVNESASVPFWRNDSVDVVRTCPSVGSSAGGVLLTVIGRNFEDSGRLACSFQIRDYGYAVTSPAFYINSTRVSCRVPPYSGEVDDEEFTQEIEVRVSNHGVHFSTTAATFTFVSNAALAALDTQAELSTCLVGRSAEEGFREDDKAWFAVRGLSKAKLSFDFRHIPPDMVYDEHYKIALFVKNSTCEYQSCDARGVIKPSGTDIETSPCKLPVELPKWFMSTDVDKHDVLNITLLALEDVIVKVEIHIMYGLYAPAAPFFVNSTTVQLKTPVRSNVTQGVDADSRPLSRTISNEEALIPRDYTFVIVYFGGDGDYTSAPLNLPPKYQDFERGRVLLSHNVSNASTQIPLVVDAYEDVKPEAAYWVMPYGSTELTHQMALKYRETFHELYVDPTDSTGTQYLFKFDKILLSYLPFFSNCMEYDSYIPIFDLFESESCQLPEMTSEQESYGRNWWRRKFPPLPNQDDIRYVGPLDVGAEPTADICMMDLQCHYEEDLPTADVTPRWFEQSQDTVLFYLLREPTTMANYFRGGGYYDELYDSQGSDYFIPVTVDNSASTELEGDCSTLCFPRSVTLDVSYYQLDNNVKRIIMAKLVLAEYDRDAATTGYTFSVNLHPLDYYQLIIQFAFEQEVYLLLFVVLGGAMTVGAFVFWAIVRITTFLESPPRFRFYAVFALIAPPPSVGVALASVPIFSVVCAFYLLLKGDLYYTTASGYWLLDNIIKHFLDDKIDPDEVDATRKGRIGFCFLAFGLYLILLGAKIFLPKPIAISEKIIAEKNDEDARERSIWWPTQWKRANMILTSILLGLFLCLMLEFSFWSSFGDYMFYVIVLTEVVNAVVEGWIEGQLKEALLMAPLVSALSLVGGLMTFGATDFGDFVMGNTLDFGMMLLMRVYADTAFAAIGEFISSILGYCFTKVKAFALIVLALFRSFSRSTVANTASATVGAEADSQKKKAKKEPEKEEEAKEDEEGATVEPIIDFYAGASMERLALFYQPILILLMMFFREELMLPIIYNIREKDMEIYLWYSLIILFFQLVTEVFVLNVVELFQGWKLYDYLVYCRYRFLQREQRWKGLEPNLDECIEENLRTLDQMCFSSQFFMMCTIHITGIVFFVVAIEIMARAEYNLFGDPAMPILLAFVLSCALFVRHFVMFLAVKLEIWKIKHENTAWLAPPEEDDEFGVPRWDELEKIKGASHEAYLMNQRITSETFRFKFLSYNRSWIVSQLPSILTPRTLRRARPYLLAQFAKILDSLNPQISDDDENDDGDGRPRFGPVTLSAPSRTIVRLWLARARRIQRLKAVVQPIVQQARKSECEMCLSRRQLQVELAIPIELLGDKFESLSLAEEFDVAGWKEFFTKHEKFKTLCLNCIVHLKATEQSSKRGFGGGPGFEGDDDFAGGGAWDHTVHLNAASFALMQKWYRKAQDRVFGKHGRRRNMVDVSDDEEEAMARHFEWTKKPVSLNASSTALARKWIMAARHSLRESGRSQTTLPANLTAIHPSIRGGATPIPKPAMKSGAAGGEAVKMPKMRRK